MFVLTTPTGNIGAQLLPMLLQTGAPVRVIARSPEKLTPHANLEIIEGSTDDADVLARAFVDAKSVFWCVPSPARAPDVAAHYARFTDALVGALNSLGDLPKIVTVSSSTFVSDDTPPAAGRVYDGLHNMEAAINAMGAPTCHLRNAFFMDNLLQGLPQLKARGVLSFPIPAERELKMIASADIARVAAQAMQRDFDGQTQRALFAGSYTLSRAAQLIEAATGRDVTYQRADLDATRAQLLKHGASADFVETYLAMSQAPDASEDAAAALPNAITLEEFVNQKIVPALN